MIVPLILPDHCLRMHNLIHKVYCQCPFNKLSRKNDQLLHETQDRCGNMTDYSTIYLWVHQQMEGSFETIR